MSDTTLHRVLNMSPELWSDSELDQQERYRRYTQASKRIESANALIRESYNRLTELESQGHLQITEEHIRLMNNLRDSIEL